MKFNCYLFILIPILISCGDGGGSSSKQVPDYSGAWQGKVTLKSNTCPRRIPDEFVTIETLHNVTQSTSEDAAGNIFVDILIEDGEDNYVGVGDSDLNISSKSFRATGNPHELPGFLDKFTCIETLSFQYSSVNLIPDASGTVKAGFFERESSITCTNSKEIRTCDVSYTGSASSQR